MRASFEFRVSNFESLLKSSLFATRNSKRPSQHSALSTQHSALSTQHSALNSFPCYTENSSPKPKKVLKLMGRRKFRSNQRHEPNTERSFQEYFLSTPAPATSRTELLRLIRGGEDT